MVTMTILKVAVLDTWILISQKQKMKLSHLLLIGA